MKKSIFLKILILISQTAFSQLYIAENTEVRLNNDVDLAVATNVKNDGAIRGSGFLRMTGDVPQTINGSGKLENFSIDKNSGTVEITEGHQDVLRTFLIHGGTFSPNAKLTLKSNDTLTAQMGQNTGGSITGDIVIERFIPQSNRAFRYFSSPVSTSESIRENLQEGQNNLGINYPADNLNGIPGFGTHITGSKTGNNGFDATESGNPSFFNWNSTSQSWNAIFNTQTNTLEKGESFTLLVRGSRESDLSSNTAIGPSTTLRLTGNPSILNVNTDIQLDQANSFVLLGNPYPSAIDAVSVLQRHAEINQNYIYVYDPTLNTRGGYATVELPGGTNAQGSQANQFIQPWQSVFVEVLNTEPTLLNLSFQESDKRIAEPQLATFSVNTRINLKLKSDNEILDGLSIKLEHGANSEIDQRDARKLYNYDESLSIYSKGTSLSIEERDFPTEIDTVMIQMQRKRKDQYSFEIGGSHLSEVKAVFKDFYLDETYALTSDQNIKIDFQVAEGEPELRFGFILTSRTLSTSTDELTSKVFQVYPNPAKDVLNIKTLQPLDKNLTFDIYSLLGQKVGQGEFNDKDLISNYDISSFSEGVYLIVLTDGKQLKETLKFIKI